MYKVALNPAWHSDNTLQSTTTYLQASGKGEKTFTIKGAALTNHNHLLDHIPHTHQLLVDYTISNPNAVIHDPKNAYVILASKRIENSQYELRCRMDKKDLSPNTHVQLFDLSHDKRCTRGQYFNPDHIERFEIDTPKRSAVTETLYAVGYRIHFTKEPKT